MFPLFCDYDFLNLTFAYRLEPGYISFSGKFKAKIISSLLLVIDDNYNFRSEESSDEFLSFVHRATNIKGRAARSHDFNSQL